MCKVVTTENMMSNLSVKHFFMNSLVHISSFFVFFSGGIKTLPLKTAYRLYVQTHLTGDRSADHKRYVSVGSLNLSNLMFFFFIKKKNKKSRPVAPPKIWRHVLGTMMSEKYKTVQYCASAKKLEAELQLNPETLTQIISPPLTSDLWPVWWNYTFLGEVTVVNCCLLMLIFFWGVIN